MPKQTHKYTNNEVTVVWKPEQCIHSKLCWNGLKEVFDPTKRPWINMQGATTQRIIDQVRHCPSGALSYYMNEAAETTKDPVAEAAHIVKVEVSPRGPYLLNTECIIQHADGRQEVKKGKVALCRCGSSNNKPYCDGRHKEINFEG
ncbi:(4Fe-4S)-binding protein [Paraflavitalea speifideaquila]|uniref:(4Fe-4S)-binding protein n=1 Tax=Paraflavitalea speifideaquila TaxID=3076558 RepID=UPI0028E32E52|nr:(4Fe-4S)-binding protein [Paraflavitalea speifideiaquila]